MGYEVDMDGKVFGIRANIKNRFVYEIDIERTFLVTSVARTQTVAARRTARRMGRGIVLPEMNGTLSLVGRLEGGVRIDPLSTSTENFSFSPCR